MGTTVMLSDEDKLVDTIQGIDLRSLDLTEIDQLRRNNAAKIIQMQKDLTQQNKDKAELEIIARYKEAEAARQKAKGDEPQNLPAGTQLEIPND